MRRWILPLLVGAASASAAEAQRPVVVVLGVRGDLAPEQVLELWTERTALGLAQAGISASVAQRIEGLPAEARGALVDCVSARACEPAQLMIVSGASALVTIVATQQPGRVDFQFVGLVPATGQVVESRVIPGSMVTIPDALPEEARAFGERLQQRAEVPARRVPPWRTMRTGFGLGAGAAILAGGGFLLISGLDYASLRTDPLDAGTAFTTAARGKLNFGIGIGVTTLAVALAGAALFSHLAWVGLQPVNDVTLSVVWSADGVEVAGRW